MAIKPSSVRIHACSHFNTLLIILIALCANGMILTSTLNSTSRGYACETETVVITCSGGIGRELVWHYDDLQFVFDNNTGNLPQAMYNKPARAIVYLTNRTSVGNGMFQYTSQLSISIAIERITAVDPVDVNCTVTSDPVNMENLTVRTLSVRESGIVIIIAT